MIRAPYLLGGAVVLGLAASTADRFSLAGAAALAVLAVAQPRVAVVCVLVVAGWWWGSARLHALDRSELASYAGTAGRVLVHVSEPPRRSRFDMRVRGIVRRWRGARVHEPVLLKLPASRAPPPQGADLSALATVRPPADYERTWLRRHGVHVVLHASVWRVVHRRGGVADRLHAWLVRGSTPGLAGERRAVLDGVVLGEDDGLSDELRRRFRASGLYHLLAVSGGNVVVVGGGAVGLALLLGVSRLAAEVAGLVAILGYVLAVGPQPSVLRAGVAGALGSLAWLTGRQRDRWYAVGTRGTSSTRASSSPSRPSPRSSCSPRAFAARSSAIHFPAGAATASPSRPPAGSARLPSRGSTSTPCLC